MSRDFAHPDKITFVKAAREDAAADTASIEATVKQILADVRGGRRRSPQAMRWTFDKTCPEVFEVSTGGTAAGP
jgi:hypothetical protein